MKRVSSLLLAAICLLSLVVPSIVLAANSVPTEALKARESVYRVLCEDSEYTYSGSSFVVGADVKGTYLVTNYHVIEGANLQSIAVVGRDGSELPASVVGYDTDYDLCIMQTNQPLKGAAAISIASGEAAVGEAVYALGFPGAGDYLLDDYAYAAEDITVTDGIISAVKTVTTGAKKTTFLQMNAAINPGSSGGPLVNGEGQVVGINTLGILEAQDVYAAVSSKHIRDILRQYSVPLASAVHAEAGRASIQTTSPWIWPVVGVCTVLALGAFVLLILRSRRLTLARLLSRRLQGYSPEEAMYRLSSVFQTLSQLHARGEVHGNINPANLYMDKRGVLHLGGRRRKCALNDKTRSFMPMEQYDTQTNAGTYSDMYALGAVLFAMLTCTPPPDVISRLQHDTLEERLKGIQGLSWQLQETLLMAMALKKEERLHDMERFLRAIESFPIGTPCVQWQEHRQTINTTPEQAHHTEHVTEVLPVDWPENTPNAHWYDMPGAPKRRHMDKKSRQKMLTFSFCAALAVIALLLVCNEASYQSAVKFCETRDFEDASISISCTFLFYRDTNSLCDYVSAGRYLQVGFYQEAKQRFLALGEYRDAEKMALECDYQYACTLLTQGKYDAAKALFIKLQAYSDSSAMVLECDYQSAKKYLSNLNFNAASDIFKRLSQSQYRDSKQLVLETEYKRALEIYSQYCFKNPEDKLNSSIYNALDILRSLQKENYPGVDIMVAQVQGAMYEEAVYLYTTRLEDNFRDHWDEFAAEDQIRNADLVRNMFLYIGDYLASYKYVKVCNILYHNSDWKIRKPLLSEYDDFLPATTLISQCILHHAG